MIEIKNLKTGYDGKTVLEIDKLIFEEGKITAIVGLNGSGKSTLLKSIVGINTYQGEILVEGKSVARLGHKKRAGIISFLPQYSPMTNMDIYTLVSHGRFPYLGYSKVLRDEDKRLVEKALRITDLWELKDKNLQEVSGGERQRAYLAMVIAQNTKFILLDEPATYMDIKHQLEMMEVLKVLVKEGRGVIFSSHDLPQSFSVCDRVCLLKNGFVAGEGTPEEVSHEYSLMKDVMGVGLKKMEEEDLLYSYNLCK